MSPTPDQDSLHKILAHICRMHHGRVHTQLEKLGLYRGQPWLLLSLWEEEGRTQTELAELRHVQPATMTKMLQRMEHAGLVERRPDPADQRVSRVYLTEAGRALHADIVRTLDALDAETFEGFTAEERATLRHFFDRILGNLQRAGEA